MNTRPVFLISFSIMSQVSLTILSISGVRSFLTPPTLQKDMTTLPPVIASKTSRTLSLILQQCMNRLSNPSPSARSPSHSRWLWTLDSSWNMILRHSALSGIWTPIRPSTAPA